MAKNSETSFIDFFILYLQKGFLLLDDNSRKELAEFIKGQQHKSGGFIDRGGNPDFYYSLFGTWLSKAVGSDENLEKIKSFISDSDKEKLNTPELFSSILIGSMVSEKSKKPSIFFLIKLLIKKNEKTNLPYRIFLFLITWNYFYKRVLFLKLLIRLVLSIYKADDDSPCSLIAALLVARKFSGMKTNQVNQKLLSYFDEEKGFKMYRQGGTSDLLSTAVALFALKITGQDLRLVAPASLDLVQRNYSAGAFLSGDGDQTRDLEYTFYGLLALGTLA